MKVLDSKNFSVPGYKTWGIHCGIKKTDKKDLAVIVSDRDASMAGVFTKNRVKAASVVLGMSKVKTGKGKQGFLDARETAELAAKEFGTKPEAVYVASTGVIGETLPLAKIRTGIATAAGLLAPSGWGQAAEAIMTTDNFPKIAVVQEEIGGKTITLAGISKGSGMIHPNMATMLCFIVTDALIAAPMLRKMLTASVDQSFNRITVDGDTSTNDMVLFMANGAAGNKRVASGSKDFKKLQACLDAVTHSLALQIVKDGEGATKFVEITVRGAKNPVEARRAVSAVAKSSLVKTALFGEDANWGRIMAVLGSCGVDMNEVRTDISFGKTKLVEKGVAMGKHAEKEAAAALKQREIHIGIDLHKGKGASTIWTCDLSTEYVKINAAYRS
jgi:glutamate N-acetyltransferase/amino-acid N-acetyltransferase